MRRKKHYHLALKGKVRYEDPGPNEDINWAVIDALKVCHSKS